MVLVDFIIPERGGVKTQGYYLVKMNILSQSG
jgi:hypothetical protein